MRLWCIIRRRSILIRDASGSCWLLVAYCLWEQKRGRFGAFRGRKRGCACRKLPSFPEIEIFFLMSRNKLGLGEFFGCNSFI
jgi:hypothetical protein